MRSCDMAVSRYFVNGTYGGVNRGVKPYGFVCAINVVIYSCGNPDNLNAAFLAQLQAAAETAVAANNYKRVNVVVFKCLRTRRYTFWLFKAGTEACGAWCRLVG